MVLFDEIEKAHPDIWGILLQIMEDGMVTDAQGRKADFKNAIVVLTSNVGAARITAKGSKLGFSATERRDGETRPIEELKAAVLDDLKKCFARNFLTAWTRLSSLPSSAGRRFRPSPGACWNVWESV